jgi:hypothetical protein
MSNSNGSDFIDEFERYRMPDIPSDMQSKEDEPKCTAKQASMIVTLLNKDHNYPYARRVLYERYGLLHVEQSAGLEKDLTLNQASKLIDHLMKRWQDDTILVILISYLGK